MGMSKQIIDQITPYGDKAFFNMLTKEASVQTYPDNDVSNEKQLCLKMRTSEMQLIFYCVTLF